MAELDAGGVPRAEQSLLTGGVACYRVYRTADERHLAVGALEHKFWKAFCAAAGLPELVERHWAYGEAPGSDAARQTIDRVAARLRAEDAGRVGTGVRPRSTAASTPVLSPAEALAHPHHRARGLVRSPGRGHRNRAAGAVVRRRMDAVAGARRRASTRARCWPNSATRRPTSTPSWQSSVVKVPLMHVERRRILLMRHGAVEYFDEHGRPYPPDDVPLTARGVEQARAMGKAIAASGVRIDRAITSGLVRTRTTAQQVLDAAGVTPPVEHRGELQEIRGGQLAEHSRCRTALGLHRRLRRAGPARDAVPERRDDRRAARPHPAGDPAPARGRRLGHRARRAARRRQPRPSCRGS